MVIVEPEERVVRHYRRTSWLSSVPLLAFVVMAYVAFASGGADFALPSRRACPERSRGDPYLAAGVRAALRHFHLARFLQQLRQGAHIFGRCIADGEEAQSASTPRLYIESTRAPRLF